MKNVAINITVAVTLGCSLLSPNVFGQGSVFAQASFEGISGSVTSPSLVVLGTNSGTIGGWTATASGLLASSTSVTIGTLSGPPPADGTNIARLSMPLGVGETATLGESSMTALLPNTTYNLSVSLDQGTTLGLINGTTVQLLAGTTPVATLTGTTLAGLLDSAVGFQTVNLPFTTGATAPTGNLGVLFTSASVLSLGGSVYVDNVGLTITPTPEPNWAVFLVPVCGIFALHRWRRLPRGSYRPAAKI